MARSKITAPTKGKRPTRPSRRLNSQDRALMRQLDAQFPDNKRDVNISCNPAMEIANLRSCRDGFRTKEFDLSGMQWMQPFNRQKVAAELASAQEERFNWRGSLEDRDVLKKLMNDAYDSKENVGKAKELADYRQFEITTDILAMPFAFGAFQSINLSADELVQIITPKTRQYFNVMWMGQDGGTQRAQWRTARSATELEMRLVSTERVEYPLIDLQLGDVNEFDKINQQLRWDMEYKLDNLALESLLEGKAESGLRAKLNIHPDIDQDNIPDTNYLDLTNTSLYGADGVWTLQRLKAVLRHFAMWGYTAGADPDGPIKLVSMLMSPQNAQDAWEYVDLVSGFDSSFGEKRPSDTITQSQREQIMSSGSLMQSAWGHSWTTQFNARIKKGRLYCLTNQPIGWFFTKTDWDRVIEWRDDPEHVEQNIGEIMLRRSVNFVRPELWGYRYLIVDFAADRLDDWED